MNVPTEWIHIGSSALTTEQFEPIENVPLSPKPNGGVWASPFLPDSEFVSEWHRLSINLWGDLRSQEAVIFRLKQEANIYIIDTQKDLIRLIEEVGQAKHPLFEELLPPSMKKVHIDYENAQHFYDVIYLTERGQYETRHPYPLRDYNLYGWDCECCYILNQTVIEQQRPFKISV